MLKVGFSCKIYNNSNPNRQTSILRDYFKISIVLSFCSTLIYADLQVRCLRQVPPQALYMHFLNLPHPIESHSVHCLGSCEVSVKAAGLDAGLKLGLSFSTLLDRDPNYHNDKNRVLKLNDMFTQTNEKYAGFESSPIIFALKVHANPQWCLHLKRLIAIYGCTNSMQ